MILCFINYCITIAKEKSDDVEHLVDNFINLHTGGKVFSSLSMHCFRQVQCRSAVIQ